MGVASDIPRKHNLLAYFLTFQPYVWELCCRWVGDPHSAFWLAGVFCNGLSPLQREVSMTRGEVFVLLLVDFMGVFYVDKHWLWINLSSVHSCGLFHYFYLTTLMRTYCEMPNRSNENTYVLFVHKREEFSFLLLSKISGKVFI